MVFYRIKAHVKNDENSGKHFDCVEKGLAEAYQVCSDIVYEKLDRNCFIFVYSISVGEVFCAAIADGKSYLNKAIKEFLHEANIEAEVISRQEISMAELHVYLKSAERADLVEDYSKVADMFGLGYLFSRRRDDRYTEDILTTDATLCKLQKRTEDIMCDSNLKDEVERIFAHKADNIKAKGHPVHYMIRTDDADIRDNAVNILLSALIRKHRIENRRYCTVNYRAGADVLPGELLDALYRTNKGGALVITFGREFDNGGDADLATDRGEEVVAAISGFMQKYKNDVLTVLCLERRANKYKDIFYENLGVCSVVEIKENYISRETGYKYLCKLAAKRKLKDTDAIREMLSGIGETVLTAELNRRFDDWYTRKLRTEYYPEYTDAEASSSTVSKKEPKGDAYTILENMVGLSEAKAIIKQAVDYYKAQRLFACKGMVQDTPSMHMVFTGNPGTAKTTVARLFSRIMKDNGMLDSGDIHEVGRAELVGKYVGHTAVLVKDAFRRALGGVLFIDEAYSLVDGRDGSFGDEAINTIVQEMENNRKDIVVIFAGYPDKMEQFLDKNPGLRSRIAFHVPFADYNTDELCRIAKSMASEKGLSLTEDAEKKLALEFELARKIPDFGNGRYVRNTIERAKMAQAGRIIRMGFDSVSENDVRQLCADDIVPVNIGKRQMNRIGF